VPSTVVLDIFSGRPNPQWVLAPKLAKQIFDFISSAQPLRSIQPEEPGGLSYRGLLVDLRDFEEKDITVRIFNGLVYVGDDIFQDDGYHIENLLLASAEGQVDAALIEIARNARR
jgi:hypothetical protein